MSNKQSVNVSAGGVATAEPTNAQPADTSSTVDGNAKIDTGNTNALTQREALVKELREGMGLIFNGIKGTPKARHHRAFASAILSGRYAPVADWNVPVRMESGDTLVLSSTGWACLLISGKLLTPGKPLGFAD